MCTLLTLTNELSVGGVGPGHHDLHDQALARLEAAGARPHFVSVWRCRLHFVSDDSDRKVPHLDPSCQLSKRVWLEDKVLNVTRKKWM